MPMPRLMNPRRLFPQPSPRDRYRLSAKRGKLNPAIVRTKAVTPVALAAYPCICVNHVGLATLEADDKADGKQRGADVGRYPVGLVLRCPAVDEQARGDNEPPGNHQGKAVFWPASVAIVFGEPLIYLSK